MNLLEAHDSWYFEPSEFDDHIKYFDNVENTNALSGLAVTSRTGETTNGFEFKISLHTFNGFNMNEAKRLKAYHWIDYNKQTDLYFGITEKIINFLKIQGMNPTRCRLSVIPAGKKIPFHNDSVSPRQYSMKLHIPITTNKDVITTMNGQDFVMESGRVYLFNANSWHGIVNNSNQDRWHFLCDVYDTEGNFSFGKCKNYDYHLGIAKQWREIIDKDLDVERLYIDA